ncbi:MAG: molybdopterin-guanine dinucleotide biosynthesis protein B [Burkholderiaceae bacterium]|jgi:molybdopterin-guanine dinucleotide biosynthesis protein B|nr:molybdopterin-guanine dinucleotide biosynthesis protein B [Aquabacterium sp.]NUP84190.1 molybdopterin-guanine dinucleotide biosynthesis protein B [Burkholderiaceae bacterium]
MNVIGFCGPSGVGKTTLIEQLVAELKKRGQRVSVLKHAHKTFEIDYPGKDTWRHRQAGALEVLIASGHRLAKMREYEVPGRPTVHQLIAEMVEVDWLLVEGFKDADIPKVEVWRSDMKTVPFYTDDPFIVGIACDDGTALPQSTLRPVFGLPDPVAVADFLISSGDRFTYNPEHHG